MSMEEPNHPVDTKKLVDVKVSASMPYSRCNCTAVALSQGAATHHKQQPTLLQCSLHKATALTTANTTLSLLQPSPLCNPHHTLPAGVPRALLATEAASQWGQGNCWTIGTAPICAGSCADCYNEGADCVNGNYLEGAKCWTGRKVRCCKNRW